MTQQNTNSDSSDTRRNVAIEGTLPVTAVGIENLKEDNPKHMPPHRYLLPWFARRPTPAARLAILGSVLPKGVDNDELLSLMQIEPKFEVDQSLEDYVEEKKATENDRSGNLRDHYGYPRPFTSTPSKSQRDELHSKLKEHWDGELPTILDPTAGGGVIPFESLRYGLPTEANELNPIPWSILKAILDYPLSVGHLSKELHEWGEKVNEQAKNNLKKYYPGEEENQSPSHFVVTYKITCSDCGDPVPTTPTWWLLKRSPSEGIAVRPNYSKTSLSYELVNLPEDVTKDEFDPQNGPKTRGGDVECPSCGVVTESNEVKKKIREGDFDYEILGVKYITNGEGSGYRKSTSSDYDAIEKVNQRVDKSKDMFSILNKNIPENGQKTSEPIGHGMNKWQDLFTPRQLLAHYEYWQAFEDIKQQIQETYNTEKAEAILTILSFAAGKMVDRNSRLSPYSISRGYPENALGGKNYSFQWVFVDNNPTTGDQKYVDVLDRIISSYKDIVNYLEGVNVSPARITSLDAASLEQEDESVQAIIIDPPYYSSIMYAELSDIFYVWLKRYLDDVHPEVFKQELTDKENEAVANPSQFKEIAGENTSKKELAKNDYESKMSSIFSELYKKLEHGGVMTVMFTHKETDAWDTLTMSLINSGFTVSATHPITSEMPYRMDTRGGGSADSTLLLTARKPINKVDTGERNPTLWEDVKSQTRTAAKVAAEDLIESGLNLTKTDIIVSAFGPTLRVFSENYPVVDDQGDEIAPRKALEEARTAVTEVIVDEYLANEGIDDLDPLTRWYILSWLVYERDAIPYDEARQLGLGVGVDIDNIKRDSKIWRKSGSKINLQGHNARVQNVNKKPDNRSGRQPVNPDSLSFDATIDKVHAAMHIYDVQGAGATWNWLKERKCDKDHQFQNTLESLLQVLPEVNRDWELARNLSVGETGDLLGLDIDKSIFENTGGGQSKMSKFSDQK